MIRIAIYDISGEFAEGVRQIIREYFSSICDVSIDIYSQHGIFLHALKQENYDLIFYRLINEREDELKAFREIYDKTEKTEVIFLSDSINIPIESTELQPLCYLKIPFQTSMLNKGIKMFISKKQLLSVIIQAQGNVIPPICLCNIIYFEIYDKTVIIHLENNTTYSFKGQLGRLASSLRAYHFVRCHHSYIINLLHINRITSRHMVMDNNEKIPIGRTYMKSFRKALVQPEEGVEKIIF